MKNANSNISTSQPILKVNDINLFYDDHHVLKGIDLEIMKNEVTAFIGPSGCGKSSFIRLFNRMNDLITESIVTGKILYKDQNIYDKNYDVIDLRINIGMVFQKPNPFPMSIFENVVYGLRRQGIKDKQILKDRAEHVLKQAALWDEVKDILNQSAMKLSGGQQQRLCIARTLAMSPEVILMDEPTSALDPIATKRIEDLINELKKEYTIIIITHNMQQAKRISDKTAFFFLGELIEFDDTNKIFNNPNNKRTFEYITGQFS